MSGYLLSSSVIDVGPSNVVLALLDTVGNGSGSTAMNVDGSETPVVFRYTCQAGTFIERITIAYADTANPTAEKYGGRLELANGITVGVYSGDERVLNLTPSPIKANADWGSITCSREPREDYGAGNNFFSYCWEWSGGSSVLALQQVHEIRAVVADNLAPLTKHTISVKGYKAA